MAWMACVVWWHMIFVEISPGQLLIFFCWKKKKPITWYLFNDCYRCSCDGRCRRCDWCYCRCWWRHFRVFCLQICVAMRICLSCCWFFFCLNFRLFWLLTWMRFLRVILNFHLKFCVNIRVLVCVFFPLNRSVLYINK